MSRTIKGACSGVSWSLTSRPLSLQYASMTALIVVTIGPTLFPFCLLYSAKFSIISNEVKNGILYGGNPFLYIKFIFKGYTDFLRGKMGKL